MLKTVYGRPCRYLTDAIAWSSHVQKELLQLDWPPELLAMEGCQELRGEQGQRLWRGLRIRMGMAYGYINVKKPMNTGTECRMYWLRTAAAHRSGNVAVCQQREPKQVCSTKEVQRCLTFRLMVCTRRACGLFRGAGQHGCPCSGPRGAWTDPDRVVAGGLAAVP